MSKFVIYPVATGVKFDLRGDNGETIATSEVYTSRAVCLRGVASVVKSAAKEKIWDITAKTAAPTNPKFELFQDKRGDFRFRLRARNGQIVAISENYTTKAACFNGIQSVIRSAPVARICSET